jgi:hypothetical protein
MQMCTGLLIGFPAKIPGLSSRTVRPTCRNITYRPTGRAPHSCRRQRELDVRVLLMPLVKEWLTSFPRTLGDKIRFQSSLSSTSRLLDGKWPDASECLRVSDHYTSRVKSHHAFIDMRWQAIAK